MSQFILSLYKFSISSTRSVLRSCEYIAGYTKNSLFFLVRISQVFTFSKVCCKSAVRTLHIFFAFSPYLPIITTNRILISLITATKQAKNAIKKNILSRSIKLSFFTPYSFLQWFCFLRKLLDERSLELPKIGAYVYKHVLCLPKVQSHDYRDFRHRNVEAKAS